MTNGEFQSDPRLWVQLRCREGRWLIHYNPHTPPGRFAVVDAQDNPVYVSKGDVVASSPEAAIWIDGYLRGSEPEADRMFGEGIWEVDLADSRWGQWRDAVSEFRRTGEWRVDSEPGAWFGVRCIVAGGRGTPAMYEERITLWQAGSVDMAIALAEAEALAYAEDIEGTYVGLAQCYALDGEPSHAAEVFSLIRESPLDHDAYVARFFDTGAERQRKS